VVATHGKHTYIIYQHPGDGGRAYHVDRETSGLSPQPLGARSTLTGAKELAQDDLDALMSPYSYKQNKRKNPNSIKVGDSFRIGERDYVVESVRGDSVRVTSTVRGGNFDYRNVSARTLDDLIATLSPGWRAWSIYNRDWTE
jgi:hypothetical protein